MTPQPTLVSLQPIALTGARDKIAKKTCIRATSSPNQLFNSYFGELKCEYPTWKTYAVPSGHDVMVDRPERLSEILVEVSWPRLGVRDTSWARACWMSSLICFKKECGKGRNGNEDAEILIERLENSVVIPHLPRPQPTRTQHFGATSWPLRRRVHGSLRTVRDFAEPSFGTVLELVRAVQ